jgi:prepilin-type N-terminal cleavage/methylation domain-containing protein
MIKSRNDHGFTLVELIIVVGMIGILMTMTIVSYMNVQKQALDNQRQASATVVSESLEKYFQKHGEYPSVPKVTDTDLTTVKQLLDLPSVTSLMLTKKATSNGWKTGTATRTSPLTYSANTDTDTSCLTGTSAIDVCDDYKIQIYKEKTGTIETIISRSKAF